MDQILNKVGSYWIGKRANKELNSVGDDINPLAESCRNVRCPAFSSMAWHFNLDFIGTWFFDCKWECKALLCGKCIDNQETPLDDFYIHDTTSFSGGMSLQSSIEGGTKWLVNKLKGKMQKPLPDLLKEYDVPVGIFPRDATNYEFNEETRKLTVYIPSVCEVGYKDSSVLRFSTAVTGYLEKGKLADIEGMKTKVMVWVKVTAISSEKSKVHFTAGLKKTRSREAYEVLRDGVAIEKF
ncbi:hypothetical protein RND71_003762 [Anisodus tanguticus]|uniref:Uncharacterized protein n=1 Tax=Anisodus tanguticus TaxID=243964 RepID=A0AAE1SZD7_9SOLA|nr:hypothetical protein RND71_003762 [Anisodus tanguticus]